MTPRAVYLTVHDSQGSIPHCAELPGQVTSLCMTPWPRELYLHNDGAVKFCNTL